MSKTHKFRISVTTGAGRFAPGAPVPVGGKTGISPEEIETIEAVHGKWDETIGSALEKADAAESAALKAAEKRAADAEKDLGEARERIAALEAVIAAQAKVDEASAALSEATEDDKALAALEDAEAALAGAREAAGLDKPQP